MLNTACSAVLSITLLNSLLTHEHDGQAVTRAVQKFLPQLNALFDVALRLAPAITENGGWVIAAALLAQNSRVLSGTAVSNSGINAIVGGVVGVNMLVFVMGFFIVLAYANGSSKAVEGMFKILVGFLQLCLLLAPIVALAWVVKSVTDCFGARRAKKTK